MKPLVPPDNSQAAPPAFKPRSRLDPPAMSAMFAALTVVCVLGAAAVMATTDRDSAWSPSGILAGIGGGSGSNRIDPATLQREIGASKVDIDRLGSLVRDNASSADKEFARVYQEIMTLKGEVTALHGQDELNLLSARVDDLRDKLGMMRANVGLLQTSLDDLGSARDGEIDRINKRLDKIDDVISFRADVTASIPQQAFVPLPRKRAPRVAWTAQETGNGTYRVQGPTGTFDVTIGSVVPGLGRIEAVRHRDGKTFLVTDK